jgi:hypothetical protein
MYMDAHQNREPEGEMEGVKNHGDAGSYVA